MKKTIVIALVASIILIFFISYARKPKKAVIAPLPIKGKIAIVLDDWGYNLNNLPTIEKIKYPLTIAVLPNIKYSARVAKELYARGFEIILHLPMQPKENVPLEKNTILVTLTRKDILEIMNDDLSKIVYAKGVSNHMGSKATSDARVMSVILKELKRRHLYFLDSYVTADSVVFSLAEKNGLKTLKRDIFLDNKAAPDYIRQQLNKLKTEASKRGFAIGIGHDRPATVAVLKELMPQIAKEGYKFVFLSELLQ